MNVDCSRYHPILEKNYDIKELFMTGMETDFLQEEAKKEENDREAAKSKQLTALKSKINTSTNFLEKGQYVRIVIKLVYKNYLGFKA
jgi:hypothetical protein